MGKNKQTIALDFDGVINPYTNGWQGEDVIPDPPTPGAREAIATLREKYRVVVYSTRGMSHVGYQAICSYLKAHGIEVDEVAQRKPKAIVYVDDRAYRFNGQWADVLRFVESYDAIPWTKRAPIAAGRVDPSCPVCLPCREHDVTAPSRGRADGVVLSEIECELIERSDPARVVAFKPKDDDVTLEMPLRHLAGIAEGERFKILTIKHGNGEIAGRVERL